MDNQAEMRLCGGTFLVLLLETKNSDTTNPDVFKGLIKCTIGDIDYTKGRTFNTFTSQYKNCIVSTSTATPLTSENTILTFNNAVRNSYTNIALKMQDFIEKNINYVHKSKWLVAALIDLILADSTIPDDAQFLINPDGTGTNKSALKFKEYHCLASFILGIWHYIITNIQDNTVGQETLDNLLSDSSCNHVKRIFVSDIGKARMRNFSVETKLPYSYYESDFHKSTNLSKINDSSRKKNMLPATFNTYLEKSFDHYSKIKTLLYAETPCEFRDFYVTNRVFARFLDENSWYKKKLNTY